MKQSWTAVVLLATDDSMQLRRVLCLCQSSFVNGDSLCHLPPERVAGMRHGMIQTPQRATPLRKADLVAASPAAALACDRSSSDEG